LEVKKIVVFIIAIAASVSFAENIPFCEYFTITNKTGAPSPITCLTVPAGKKFVLRQALVMTSTYDFKLTVNDKVLLIGYGLNSGDHDFPDNCVVVPEGQSLVLTLFTTAASQSTHLTLIGYFDSPDCGNMDFNCDKVVDFQDLANFANYWLKDYNQ
jgi:hypothetical protein